ncbi:MAG: sensor histidine kinase [Promethearchaeota archaeon]
MLWIFNSKNAGPDIENGNLLKNLLIHDLNTILQNIKTSSELSDLYIDDPELNHKVRGLLKTIKQQATRGFRLVSNVHKLSQLDSTQMHLHEIDVCNLLKNSINFVKTPLQENVSFNINTPFTEYYVKANDLLQDVFENILINAVVHNKNSIVEIIIEVSEIIKSKRKFLKMEFKDNGVGIPNARKKQIFDLKRSKNQNGNGLGLGLFLVKSLLELYKGEILVKNRVKGDYTKGSNFVLLLPKSN